MKTNIASMRLSAMSWACLSVCCASAVAQEVALKETVVTATRVEQPLTDVVADVSIIDRKVIEQSGGGTVADVLLRVPGISMTRNGGPATTTSVFVRGAESRFTAVYVDGVRLDSQSTGGASWNAIPLSQIDRIEVLRGPAAAIYGSDAMGGVIQIFTRQGQAGLTRSVEFGLGTHGTAKLDMAVSGAEGAVDYAFGISRETSEGFNNQPAANPDKDGYLRTATSGRLGWQLAAGQKVSATWLQGKTDSRYDGYTSGRDDHSLLDVTALGLNWVADWNSAYKTRVGINQSTDHYETKPSVYETETTVTSYLFQNELHWEQHLFTVALERREDKLNNASSTPVVSDRSQNALALGYGFRQGAHTLQANLRSDDDSEFGVHNTGSMAYAYGFAPHWSASASAGTAFKSPTLYQRFSYYGDASLTPEKAKNVELGLKYANQATSYGVVIYRNRVNDLIDYKSGPGACANGSGPYAGCYANTGRAQFRGVTLSAASQLNGVMLSGSVDFQDPKDLATGEQLQRRPKRMATLSADKTWNGAQWGAEWQLVGERTSFDWDTYSTKTMGGYGLINLHVKAPLTKDVYWVGRIDNVADKSYETALGYATPGRVFYMGVRWDER
jgi:vitamin B12 transporter